MAPYSKSLGGNVAMHFPELATKFANAKAAQSTLDTMTAQHGLTDAIRGGALRDSTGAITDTSFGKWLRANQDTLAKTQSPAAVMRLQSIANVLLGPQGELAAALASCLAFMCEYLRNMNPAVAFHFRGKCLYNSNLRTIAQILSC